MAQKEIKNWLDTTLVEISNNLVEMANTIKTIEGPSYDDKEIKQNINKLLTFMDIIKKYINVTVVYDRDRNLSTFPFNSEDTLIILTRDELDKIKTTNIYFNVNEHSLYFGGIIAPIELIRDLIGNLVILPYEDQQLLLSILCNSNKIKKLNELLK